MPVLWRDASIEFRDERRIIKTWNGYGRRGNWGCWHRRSVKHEIWRPGAFFLRTPARLAFRALLQMIGDLLGAVLREEAFEVTGGKLTDFVAPQAAIHRSQFLDGWGVFPECSGCHRRGEQTSRQPVTPRLTPKTGGRAS